MQLSNDYIKNLRGQSAYQDVKGNFLLLKASFETKNIIQDKFENRIAEKVKKSLLNLKY